jgi:uncharacterized membrane protein (UPF0127 family)
LAENPLGIFFFSTEDMMGYCLLLVTLYPILLYAFLNQLAPNKKTKVVFTFVDDFDQRFDAAAKFLGCQDERVVFKHLTAVREVEVASELAVAVAVAKKESEKEIALMNVKKEALENFYLYELSESTQRSVLEKFFWMVIDQYRNNASSTIHKAAKAASKTNPTIKSFVVETTKTFPKMSTIEKAVRETTIQNAVWSHFNLNTNCPFPIFASGLLYGALSDVVHSPRRQEIIVSDMMDAELKCFFEDMSKLCGVKIKEYNEVQAKAVALVK